MLRMSSLKYTANDKNMFKAISEIVEKNLLHLSKFT